MSKRKRSRAKRKTFDRCWGCGAFTPYVCARCLKPVCVILGSLTPSAGGCSKLRAAPGQPGVYHLVCTPRCRLRRAPHVLATIANGGKPPSAPFVNEAREEDFEELRDVATEQVLPCSKCRTPTLFGRGDKSMICCNCGQLARVSP